MLDASIQLRATSARLESEAAYAEAHGGELSPTMKQEFVRWYQHAKTRPGNDWPELWHTDLTPEEKATRDASVRQFEAERLNETKKALDAIIRKAQEGCPKVAR